MGRMNLEGMLESGLSEDTTLEWHLRYNHYPPLPAALIPAAKKALEYAKAEEWEEKIEMPKGVLFRGRPSACVRDVIESMHLESFLGGEES